VTLRLHLHPGTSGLAPHVAIVATGTAFDLVTINLFRGEHRTPAFQKLNPFCTAPVLEDGDEVIPETGAILLHLAERFPSARLLPTGKQERQSALRWLFHAAALHADFMTWRRAEFALNDDAQSKAAVQAWMGRRLEAAFRATDQGMTGPFLSGETLNIADIYVFMIAGWWASKFNFAHDTPRLYACMKAVADTDNTRKAYETQGVVVPAFSPV